VVRAERELKRLEHETADTVRIEPCLSPVWDTAITLLSLRESGVPDDHPRLQQAAEWLIGKEIRFRGDWQYKNPADVEPSGWVFEFENKWNPDVDDTAMVLLALRKVPTTNRQKRDECFLRGLKWMLTFQCRDGGWAAFRQGLHERRAGKSAVRRPQRHARPGCADITARILELLGYEGYDLEHPQVQRAIALPA
jgi:squalene-hopene/tetraprenyl-beta-curcumene cyclase